MREQCILLPSFEGEFSSFFSKHITEGNKFTYARLDTDYNTHMFELSKYSTALATWVKKNEPEHWAMSKFPKKRWDKMTTNVA